MGEIRIVAERTIAASAEQAYTSIADYRQHHPHILPPAFFDLAVEQGGVGAGTIITFKLKVLGRTQSARARVDEPQPGRVLTESDLSSGLVTTFTVTPEGSGSRVRIETVLPVHGISGFFQKMLIPRILRPHYADELERIERYARTLPAANVQQAAT